MTAQKLNNGFTKLSDLVIDFNGDAIAECFKNKLVKKVADCNETTMFQTEKGKIFSIYTSKLKN
jgi:hypothetical protein